MPHILYTLWQGYNLGVYDAINLAYLLCEAVKVGKDLGSEDILTNYSRISRAYYTGMAAFEQGLLTSYTDFLPMHLLRNLNYSVVNYVKPLKQLFTDMAGGEYFVYSEWDK